MKTFSASASPDAPSLQTARGFAGTNLALPGFGSLLAKRRVGWPQAALTVVSFVMTVGFGVRCLIWFVQNYDALMGSESDPVDNLLAIWLATRWALLGIGLFGVSWLWALTTNAAILRSVRQLEPTAKPPILK